MPARTLTALPSSRDRATGRSTEAVLYARVSSKDQEKEGFSIPAQLRLLREYAASKGLVVAQEFTDVETAKESGRTNFGQMLSYLKKHARVCRTILVEKTDRLYRNIKDYGTVDELDVEIRLVKENEIISRESRSSEQFVHGIKVLMARNYSLNLAEETVKGMTEKARAGIYPSCAPVGYRNVDGTDGKRIIVPDLDAAPVITELFGRFAAGRHSVKSLVKELNAEGVKLVTGSTAVLFTRSLESGCTAAISIGMARRTRVPTSRSSLANVGSTSRSCWMLAPRTGRAK